MKRIIITLVIITSLFCVSCSKDQSPVLNYQNYPMTVSGVFCGNDLTAAIDITLTSQGCGEVKINSPETLAGYTFKITPDGTTVYYDNLEIPISTGDLPLYAKKAIEMLSVAPEKITDESIEPTQTVTKLIYKNEEFTVYIKNGEEFPYLIESANASFEIDTVIYQ